MRKTKVVENPNFGKGVYNCQTTVKDLMDMLKQFPEDLTVQIVDSSNPYAWLDVKLIERVKNDWIDNVRVEVHSFER